MFEKKLSPNLPAKSLAHIIFFTGSYFLLKTSIPNSFNFIFLFIIFLIGFLLEFSPAAFFALSGAAFGLALGTTYNLCFTALLLTVTFWATRHFGIRWAIRFRKKHEKFYLFSREPFQNGWFWVLRNRLLPLIPQDDFNLGAGASSISYLPYLAGSLLGMLPQFWILAGWGNSLRIIIQSPNSQNLIIFGMWGIPALFLVFISIFYRHMESWGSEQ